MDRRKLSRIIRLSESEKRKLMDEIRAFYLEERGEEIGVIEQQQLLELFLDYMAPIAYNKGLDDALSWYKKQQEGLEADYYMLYRE